MLIFHVNNDKMWYTSLFLSSLIWFMPGFMLYNASLMCPACDVTARVREGQQYSGGFGKGPHTEIYVAPEHFGKKT